MDKIEEAIRDAIIAAREGGMSAVEFDAEIERVKTDSLSWAAMQWGQIDKWPNGRFRQNLLGKRAPAEASEYTTVYPAAGLCTALNKWFSYKSFTPKHRS